MSNEPEAQPGDQFERGLLTFNSVEQARKDPLYVDSNIILDQLSEEPPWIMSLLYADGSALSIPLELASFRTLPDPKITVFRRHKSSGRTIPCQLEQSDSRLRDPHLRNAPWTDVVQRVVPPRFDPSLTPAIMALIKQAQNLQLGIGMLKVLGLQLMNPVMFGWSSGAMAKGAAGKSILRNVAPRGAAIAPNAATLAGRLAGEVATLPATKFQQFLEAVRRLSLMRGVPQQVKADAVEVLAKRLGLEVGGQSVVKGGNILLVAKDARTALQVAADGAITFGRVRIAGTTLEIVSPTAIRPLGL